MLKKLIDCHYSFIHDINILESAIEDKLHFRYIESFKDIIDKRLQKNVCVEQHKVMIGILKELKQEEYLYSCSYKYLNTLYIRYKNKKFNVY